MPSLCCTLHQVTTSNGKLVTSGDACAEHSHPRPIQTHCFIFPPLQGLCPLQGSQVLLLSACVSTTRFPLCPADQPPQRPFSARGTVGEPCVFSSWNQNVHVLLFAWFLLSKTKCSFHSKALTTSTTPESTWLGVFLPAFVVCPCYWSLTQGRRGRAQSTGPLHGQPGYFCPVLSHFGFKSLT